MSYSYTQIPVTALVATGASPGAMFTNGIASVSGVFVGTVNVQVDPYGDGTWVNAVDPVSGTVIALTAPGAVEINNGIPCLTRLNCSAYTSGTISCRLIGQ